MNQDYFYDRCRDWVRTAAPEQQTLAWIGLGHAYATLRRLDAYNKPLLETADEWLVHFQQLRPSLPDQHLTWRVPADHWGSALLDKVLDLSADDLARCVGEAIPDLRGPALRLRVQAADGTLDDKWLVPLHISDTVRIALSFRLWEKRPLASNWPLRVGVLGHGLTNSDAFDYARWGHRFTRILTLGRVHDRCDLLIYPGSGDDLLEDLHTSPLPIRADMVLLRYEGSASVMRRVLDTLQCSGYACFHADDFRALIHRSTGLAHGLAHGFRFDQAWHYTYGANILPHLSDELADRSLAELEEAFRPSGSRRSNRGATLSGNPYHRAWRLARHAREFEHRRKSTDSISRSVERVLQQQSWIMLDGQAWPADRGFLLGRTARIEIRIGPEETLGQNLEEAFPDPDTRFDEPAMLHVWLTEPRQLDAPLHGTIELPPEGPSSVHTFEFIPRAEGDFEARILVLFRGRVLQTALLLGQVSRADVVPRPNRMATPRLGNVIRARMRIDDLRERAQFDLALVENHLPGGEPRLVALSGSAAWVVRGFNANDYHEQLNDILSHVGCTPGRYEQLNSPDSVALLRELAVQGADLREQLIQTSIARPRNNPGIMHLEYIQLVTARDGPTLPLEIVYDFDAPGKGARLCPDWENAEGVCPSSCGGGSKERICPRGFWGVSKVIERHQLSGEHGAGGDFYLQCEPDRAVQSIAIGDKLLLGTSKVLAGSEQQLVEALNAAGITSLHVQDWAAWVDRVTQDNPRLLLCLAHTGGADAYASLEISGQYLRTKEIGREHVCPHPGGQAPIVLLLGCDTVQAGQDFSPHVRRFMAKGAAIVVATSCIVDGDQAAHAATILVDTLCKTAAEKHGSLGECMRTFRRKALAQNIMLALGVMAFGDADWQLTH
ncbi:hypothetical protein [Massilia sp. UBA6681]|uniref:hypothetical protein n=1 Tax=Massilia sp. UBA6681 TaxID=1946839 RepID=UPI0025B85C9C|nr:hypothetical protein [Massilia sp. UBA6681]